MLLQLNVNRNLYLLYHVLCATYMQAQAAASAADAAKPSPAAAPAAPSAKAASAAADSPALTKLRSLLKDHADQKVSAKPAAATSKGAQVCILCHAIDLDSKPVSWLAHVFWLALVLLQMYCNTSCSEL